MAEETYKIHGRHYSIEHKFVDRHKESRWVIYIGGGGIASEVINDDSVYKDDARKLLYNYALSHLRAEYHGFQERMSAAERALRKLEGDWFYLGQFMVQKEKA